MVLQQGIDVPVWGTAQPREQIKVSFGLQSVSAAAGDDGKWQVRLAPLKASDVPADFVIAGENTITFKNVVVGEVWVCSGQSNMEFALSRINNAAREIEGATDPLIRLFNVGGAIATVPQESCRGAWVAASPKTAGSFSGVGYLYARELRQALHVPVGMISASIGGTRAEPWTSLAEFKKLPSFRARAEQYEKDLAQWDADKAGFLRQKEREKQEYPQVRAAWYRRLDAEDPGIKGKWMSAGADTSGWRNVKLPGKYGDNPLGAYLGSLWCRRDVQIPPAWVGKDLELHVGAIDEADDTYVNGAHVGRTWFEAKDFWKVQRVYDVPANLVTSTKLSVTVRVLNLYGDAGMFGPPDEMKLSPKGEAAEPVSLAGDWRYTEGLLLDGSEIPQPPATVLPGFADPASLFNGMIHPLIPYAIRGAIWYQGESNAEVPSEYRELFCGLIRSWRKAWGQGDFPFAYVQLANYLSVQWLAVEKGSWAELRDAQRQSLSEPNTSMAVAIDIGDILSIHPLDKQSVARRLALVVLAGTYHRDIPLHSGPIYRSIKKEGHSLRIQFDLAQGLHFKGDRPAGFAIAGADKVFHAAGARIDGQTLIVWSDDVPDPVAVRFGWAMNPSGVLYNAAELPASPFRSDDWSAREFTVAP